MKKMYYLRRKIASLAMASIMMAGVFTGCSTGDAGTESASADSTQSADVSTAQADGTADNASSSTENQLVDATELKIMLRADKPTGWDTVEAAVEEKLAEDGLPIDLNITWVAPADYKEKLNLAITSGEEWDLVFDASFVYLKTLASEGYYADLSSYWNNDEYPALKECFSETLIQNNEYYGQQCIIPLLRTYGSGVPSVHYRQDWADEWGIGQIDSYDKLVAYWDACLENNPGVYPLGVTGSRGFYQLQSLNGVDLANAGITSVSNSGIVYYMYINDGEVKAIAAEGSGDEAFKDFPEPYNYDFGVTRYEIFGEWKQANYTETDSLNQTDATTAFYSGLCASTIGTLDDVESMYAQIGNYSPEAEIGEFIYIDAVRNMEEGALVTGYQANNSLCIPASSTKIDVTMKFMDWIFTSEENHDLIELGIEGTDWQDNGDSTYQSLSQYSFPGYMLTWNSNYVKFLDIVPDEVLQYKKYELEESTFVSSLLPGFTFDATELVTETAQVKGITDKVSTVKLHGIFNDGTTTYDSAADMFKANLEQCYSSGAQEIEDEIVAQVNEFLANRN